jgi:hypothetical protein
VEGAVGVISTWILAALRNQKFFSVPDLNCHGTFKTGHLGPYLAGFGCPLTILQAILVDLENKVGPGWKDELLLRFSLTRGDSLQKILT